MTDYQIVLLCGVSLILLGGVGVSRAASGGVSTSVRMPVATAAMGVVALAVAHRISGGGLRFEDLGPAVGALASEFAVLLN